MAVVIVIAATIAVACHIMLNGLGLSDEFDFGAGAYYYADIPQSENVGGETDKLNPSSIPLWVYFALFLGWGYLMYRLWCWIDKR